MGRQHHFRRRYRVQGGPTAINKNGKTYLVRYERTLPPSLLLRLVNALIPILARFRNSIFQDLNRPCMRMSFIEEILQPLLNNLQEISIHTDLPLPLSRIRAVQYRIEKLLSDIVAFKKVTFKGKWYQQLRRLKF